MTAPAAAQPGRSDFIDQIGAWTIAYAEIDARSKICAAFNELSTGSRLSLVVYSDFEGVNLLFAAFDAPDLPSGASVVVDAAFESAEGSEETRYFGLATAEHAGSGFGVLLTEEEDAARLRGADRLVLSYSGYRSEPFDLGDGAAALDALERCARDRF